MKRLLTLFFSLVVFFTAQAQVPGTLSYQGILVNSSGEPVTDGPHSVQFRFFTALTGGTLIDDTAPIIVTTYKGLFTTIIGTGETGNEALSTDVANAAYLGNKAVFVEIVANGVTLSPRVRLTTVTNALHANNANIVPASGISGTLPVSKGGTGATSITGVFIGNGTAAASGLAATGGGQFFRRNVANTAYEFTDLTATNGLSASGGSLSLGGTLTAKTTIGTAGFDFVLGGTGKVGIGVTSPFTKLEVREDVDGPLAAAFSNISTGTNAYSALRLVTDQGLHGLILKNSSTRTGDGGANTMTVRNDGGDLRLLSDASSGGIVVKGTTGNVGIGTSTPAALLDVNGTSVFRGYTGINRTTAIGSSVFDVEATAGAGAYGGMYVNGTNAASWPFYGYATDGTGRAWHYVDGSTNTWHLNNGSVNRLSVTNTGFVGIGIATPTRAILEQYGQVGTTNAIFGGGSTGISLMNSFPGIGFNWYQNAGSKAIAAGFGGYLYFDHTLGDFNFNVSSVSAASANAAHTNNTRLTLKNSGRVGIGTTAPSSLLDVNGQLTLNADNNWGSGGIRFRNSLNALDGAIVQSVTGGLYYRAPSGDSQLGHRFLSGGATTEIMTLLNNGNLGIGTTAPNAKLDLDESGSTNANAVEINQNYSGSAIKYGIYNTVSSSGTNTKVGLVNVVNGASGNGYGTQNNVNPGAGSTGTFYGSQSVITAAGTGTRYGTYNDIQGAAGNTGSVVGLHSFTNHLGGGPVYGSFIDANKAASQSGTVYGQYVVSDNDGTGDSYLMYASSIGSTTGIEYGLYVTGEDVNYFSNKTGVARVVPTASANVFEVGGTASKTTAGDWLANSDRRIKTDVRDIDNSIALLKRLRPVKFKYSEEWKAKNPSIKDQYYYNFIAQEYQQVFPESVKGSGEFLASGGDEILQIDTYNAQIVSIKAVQELITQVEELQNTVAALKSQLAETQAISAQVQDLKRQLGQYQQLSAQIEELKKMVSQQAATTTAVGNDKK